MSKSQRLSISKMTSCAGCSMRYFFQYVCNLKRKPSFDMILGTGAHKGNEVYLNYKKTGVEVNYDYIMSSIEEESVKEWDKYDDKAKCEAEKVAGDKRQAAAKDKRKSSPYVANMTEVVQRSQEATISFMSFYEENKTHVMPFLIEEWFDEPIANKDTGEVIPGFSVCGKIDLCETLPCGGCAIKDHKIQKGYSDPESLSHNLQLGLYKSIVSKKHNVIVKEVGQYNIVKNKDIVVAEVLAREIPSEDLIFSWFKWFTSVLTNQLFVPNFDYIWHNNCEFLPLCSRYDGNLDKMKEMAVDMFGTNNA